MISRYATLRKVLDLLVQSTDPCERCQLSGNLFIDTPQSGDSEHAPVQTAQGTSRSLSRLPGSPDRLSTRNPAASRPRRTTPLAE